VVVFSNVSKEHNSHHLQLEDGGSVFLQNTGKYTQHMVSKPTRKPPTDFRHDNNEFQGVVFLHNVTGTQLVKKFPTIHGNQRFITMFTKPTERHPNYMNAVYTPLQPFPKDPC
jgi:hypothetical protein